MEFPTAFGLRCNADRVSLWRWFRRRAVAGGCAEARRPERKTTQNRIISVERLSLQGTCQSMGQMIDGFDWDRDDDLRGKRQCGCLVGMMPSRYITFISYDGLLAVTYNAPSSRRTDRNSSTFSSWTDGGGTQRWAIPSLG